MWSDKIEFVHASHALGIRVYGNNDSDDKYEIQFFSKEKRILFLKNDEEFWSIV